ncbi:hypothetical protein BCR43DRAFT_482425 [Syncephalastrum racemosum]|uniref:Uncharacterized protein n=1 Tax=Syncephalastrum racemosum TaxID=13706 RepID=A0A1X2HV24_SYNRA|nr:hypothetical protein BCR43DRAFT_482425 [Syncephalastrum racemosum]
MRNRATMGGFNRSTRCRNRTGGRLRIGGGRRKQHGRTGGRLISRKGVRRRPRCWKGIRRCTRRRKSTRFGGRALMSGLTHGSPVVQAVCAGERKLVTIVSVGGFRLLGHIRLLAHSRLAGGIGGFRIILPQCGGDGFELGDCLGVSLRERNGDDDKG